MISKAQYKKSSNIGIFAKSNNSVTIIPPRAPESFKRRVKDTLKTELIETTISNSSLIGIFVAMNDETIVVPETTTGREIDRLKDHFSEIRVLESKYTALGNLIAMNNNSIAASEVLEPEKNGFKPLEVGGTDLIGSTLFLTNEGFLAHMDAKKEELEEIENIFGVKGDVGSVNFGDTFVKNGLIGNDEGILVGQQSTGPELNRIDEVFMLK